jgi:circadian clock protein KaiC
VELPETGIPRLDVLGFGGLPERRTTLLTGTTQSGKTVFALQFLVAGCNSFGEPGGAGDLGGVSRSSSDPG